MTTTLAVIVMAAVSAVAGFVYAATSGNPDA